MQFENHVKVRQEKFGAVVFETLREKVFVTNETGADILRLLEEGKGDGEIVTELAERFDCNPEIITKDVEDFISNLKNSGIIGKGDEK